MSLASLLSLERPMQITKSEALQLVKMGARMKAFTTIDIPNDLLSKIEAFVVSDSISKREMGSRTLLTENYSGKLIDDQRINPHKIDRLPSIVCTVKSAAWAHPGYNVTLRITYSSGLFMFRIDDKIYQVDLISVSRNGSKITFVECMNEGTVKHTAKISDEQSEGSVDPWLLMFKDGETYTVIR